MHVTLRCILVCFGSTLLGMSFNSPAYALTGMELEIGTSNNVYYPGSGAWGGAAIGYLNDVQDSGAGSLAVGFSNHVHGSGNAAFGEGNMFTYSYYSTAIGYGNYLFGENAMGVDSSLVLGVQNFLYIGVSGGVVAGYNNHVGVETNPALEDPVPIVATATFGFGLNNKWNNATLVGQWNSTSPTGLLLFAIGNGDGVNNRSNAMEVYKDGKVILPKAQGDILMGEFGN